MEKRFLLAIALSFAILFVYQYYIERQQRDYRRQHPESVSSRPPTSAVPPTEIPQPAARGSEAAPPGELERGGAAAMLSQDLVEASSPCSELVVDAPLYRAVFCAQSGRLMSWRLKKYRTSEKCSCEIPGVRAILGGAKVSKAKDPAGTTSGELIERVHVKSPLDLPLGLEVVGEGLRKPLATSLSPDRHDLDVTETGPRRVSFVGQTPIGGLIRKTFAFSPESYLVHLTVEIEDVRPEFHDLSIALVLTESAREGGGDKYSFSGFMGLVDGSLVKDDPKKIAKEALYHAGRVDWAGFSDKYFLTGVLPFNNPLTSVKVERIREGVLASSVVYNIRPHLDGTKAVFEYDLYIGPKDMDVLKKTGYGLERSLDLGWFGPIAKPLLVILKLFNRYTHNYGLAIIILTIVIKILFHPLTRKQYASMKQMQKLQPKMQAIREKFKDDRERMNKEIMDLYRTHKINPLSGCWPMLLQIPVFFALYKALLNSIELRQAPFFLWIRDLSDKDPCYITPLVMGASMFVQQKMTPAAGDPAQQKMMMFMPLIFTVMFLNFPSGLVVYWLVNNIISIGQQYFAQREGR